MLLWSLAEILIGGVLFAVAPRGQPLLIPQQTSGFGCYRSVSTAWKRYRMSTGMMVPARVRARWWSPRGRAFQLQCTVTPNGTRLGDELDEKHSKNLHVSHGPTQHT